MRIPSRRGRSTPARAWRTRRSRRISCGPDGFSNLAHRLYLVGTVSRESAELACLTAIVEMALDDVGKLRQQARGDVGRGVKRRACTTAAKHHRPAA